MVSLPNAGLLRFFPDSEEMRAAGSGSLPWELEERHIVWMVTVFQFVYWVVTIVILMNLLIAMMASTYQKVSDNAEAEYQMQFAKIVKENYETTVLPVPLNMFEHLANHLASRCQKRQELGKISLRWGRHYTWPASSLPFQLKMAARKVQVKKETEKAARKLRESKK